MFLLFGLRTREHTVTRRTMVCEVCGVAAAQTLVKQSTKFTLFFIPLFPVRRSTYYLRCGHCWAARAAEPDWATALH